MPRCPRLNLPDIPQHVIQRGNDGIATFRAPEDYRKYLSCLASAAESYACLIHAYVLMTNHVHLVITQREPDGVARTIQMLGRRYVRYFNRRYQRRGTLWEGRYRGCLIESERYLLTCYRYVELNPVRAGMVGDPANYPWSSHLHNAYGLPDPLVTTHDTYDGLAHEEADRRAAYHALFLDEIPQEDLISIRLETNSFGTLGTEAFRRRIERLTRRRIQGYRRGPL